MKDENQEKLIALLLEYHAYHAVGKVHPRQNELEHRLREFLWKIEELPPYREHG